jgi:glycosyltransferase involved in cell wall biosynthesis
VVADLQGSLTGELIDHHAIPAGGPLPALSWAIERASIRGPDRILASSAAFARHLADQWGLCDRVVALPDGVDSTVFRAGLPVEELRRGLGLTGRRVVVYLGVLTPHQGIDDLIAAWPTVTIQMPDAHLLLMGYPNEARYRDAVERAGLAGSVTITGRIDYAEAPRYLALGDVAVSAKRSATEANGKLLNYMAMGLPTVAYDKPVAREILGPAGVLVPSGDTAALGAACIGLLRNPSDRKWRGETLRERAVTVFDWRSLAGKLIEIYRTLRAERTAATDRR